MPTLLPGETPQTTILHTLPTVILKRESVIGRGFGMTVLLQQFGTEGQMSPVDSRNLK